jgi:hypothetical protein
MKKADKLTGEQKLLLTSEDVRRFYSIPNTIRVAKESDRYARHAPNMLKAIVVGEPYDEKSPGIIRRRCGNNIKMDTKFQVRCEHKQDLGITGFLDFVHL